MDKDAILQLASPFIRSMRAGGAFLCVPGNVMTIGWAQLGWQWNKPIVTVLVRPSRYTYGIIEKSTDFTVCIPFEGKMKKELAYAGRVSGRDEDKLASNGIKALPAKIVASPIIASCEYYAECKIVYKRDMTNEFLDESIIKMGYPTGDFHRLYFGEVVECYKGN